jgi:hypothetical protein
MSSLESSISVFSQHFPQFEQRMKANSHSMPQRKDSQVIVFLVARESFDLSAVLVGEAARFVVRKEAMTTLQCE